MAYYISASNTDDEHQTAGWYYIAEDDQGDETVRGPFLSKHIALDDMSGGAYTDWLQSVREDDQHQRQFGIFEQLSNID